MVTFVDEHRCRYGVEPICEALPIAPSTYDERKLVAREPHRRLARDVRDEHIRPVLEEHRQVYEANKVWRQLRRNSIDVARCRAEWLIRQTRGARHRRDETQRCKRCSAA
jgi:hypothetical protein